MCSHRKNGAFQIDIGKGLRVLAGDFAVCAGNAFSRLVAAEIPLEVASLNVRTWNDVSSDLPIPGFGLYCSLSPLPGIAVMVFDATASQSILAAVLDDSAPPDAQDRQYSMFEQRVLRRHAAPFLQALAEAFTPWNQTVHPALEAAKPFWPGGPRPASPEEHGVYVTFYGDFANCSSKSHLWLPLSLLAPLQSRFQHAPAPLLARKKRLAASHQELSSQGASEGMGMAVADARKASLQDTSTSKREQGAEPVQEEQRSGMTDGHDARSQQTSAPVAPLEGVEALAAVLMALGEEFVAQMPALLRPEAARALFQSMLELGDLPRETLEGTLVRSGARLQATGDIIAPTPQELLAILQQAIGARAATQVLDQEAPSSALFSRVRCLHASHLVPTVRLESAQTIAMLCSQLHPDVAAAFLLEVPETQRLGALTRLAAMVSPPQRHLDDLAATILESISTDSVAALFEAPARPFSPRIGLEAVADILSEMDPASREETLFLLEEQNELLYEELQEYRNTTSTRPQKQQ